MTGFEPATPATRTQCATKLRYIPIFYICCILSTLTQFGFNWNLASVSLAKCATFRFFIFVVFYRPSRSLALIGIWLPFHSPSALFRFFIFTCILSTLTQFSFNWNLASVSLAKCAIPIFYIYCILSTLTQFGFNWNLASVPLAKCAIPIFIRLAGSYQQFVQQYYTKKIKNQTNFYEKFQ